VICGLLYCEISCNKGSGGNFVGVAGVSGSLPIEFWDGFAASCFRGAGGGEAGRVLLRGLSRSAGSLYEVGGLLGLRDWYRCSLGGTPCFSGGDGVGDREETCVIVGDTAADSRDQYIISASQKQTRGGRDVRFQTTT